MSVMFFSRFTTRGISRTTALAASFASGIHESFLARDELKFLAPVFKIYCLCSGFTFLSLHPYPSLWSVAQEDLHILQGCLSELSKRWRSAIGALRALQSAMQSRGQAYAGKPAQLLETKHPERDHFFIGFLEGLCRICSPYDEEATLRPKNNYTGNHTFGAPRTDEICSSDPQIQQNVQPVGSYGVDDLCYNSTLDLFRYDQFGNWLLNEPSFGAFEVRDSQRVGKLLGVSANAH
ncbi:hypothetical protein K469DRAFT_104559 [Zopfia rhizophila CBS 207.26]|uniref:Uncharacterized protein n=1 Tax=Zopfia rhizophila CBS 207.26 TaxID=1314779 RepID=A0A6A6E9G5_9PEZI|nr:hypothetical protein K469DRAFT_104559 [Zopfia rhizophila CBS 207.26]